MVRCALFVLGPLWIHILTQAGSGEELSRDAVLSWFRERVLEGLGLEEPPLTVQSPDGTSPQPQARHAPRRVPRSSRTAWVNRQGDRTQETQMILFPSSASSCVRSDSTAEDTTSSHFTYHFQPSITDHDTLVTSAHFWFYAGEGANSSAPLFIGTSGQQLLQAADAPSVTSSDGWVTYHLDQSLQASQGPFMMEVRCPACPCHSSEADKTPFLHVHTRPRGPVRLARRSLVTIPWSPSAIDLFQRPPQDKPQHSDCHRAQIEISFEELGWDNWIVHPKLMTFYYCHGNCSAWDRTTAMLGITQCCAPVPGTMKSLRITTTSDSGYSFRYETLPNITPEECACI